MSLLQFQCPGYADEIEDESKRLGMQSMGKKRNRDHARK